MPKTFKITTLLLIFFFAAYKRLTYFDQTKKDVYAYQKAVEDLIMGINPYKWTIESYSNPDDPGNHGYAYLPGFLYINYVFYIIHLITKINFDYLWKIPLLLADLGVGLLLVKQLYKKNFPALLLGLLVWFLNPYFYLKTNYVYLDPLPVFFMFLALFYLEKDDVLAGASYAFSIALKTFPLVLFPIFLFKSKNKLQFLASVALIGVVISLPFMTSVEDFTTYLRGALLVHEERFVQGRPFLFYISYFYHVEFFQIVPFQVYTYLAMFSGWVVSSAVYLLKWIRDKYALSIIPLALFYVFTPVLNRTYLIWLIPILVVGLYNLVSGKKYMWFYYAVLGFYWGFYYWYLVPWKDGFHIWRP